MMLGPYIVFLTRRKDAMLAMLGLEHPTPTDLALKGGTYKQAGIEIGSVSTAF